MFGKKYALTINVPKSIEVEYLEDIAKILGNKNSVYVFVKEIRKLSNLKDGQLAKLDKLTLKVSDSITDDRFNEFWIEMPDHAWNIHGE